APIHEVSPRIKESVLRKQDQGRHGSHQIDENGNCKTFSSQVMKAPQWLGEIKREGTELKIIADHDGTGQGQNDHDHVSLEPEEIPVGVSASIEMHHLAQHLDHPVWIGSYQPDAHALLRGL